MTSALGQEARTRYAASGVLFPIPALGAEDVSRYRSAFLALAAALGGEPKPAQLGQCHLFFRWAYELAVHGAVLDAVERLIGPDILVHSTTLFPKYPRDPSFVSWHQDGHYWDLDAPSLVSAWIALTDSTPENGCVRVVPGSHRARVAHTERRTARNLLTTGLEVAAQVDEAQALDVLLPAGSMSLHHVNLVHGSQPNASHHMRLGFAVRYVAPYVRQPTPHHAVLLARGQDRHRHYTHASPPRLDASGAVAAHAAFAHERQRARGVA